MPVCARELMTDLTVAVNKRQPRHVRHLHFRKTHEPAGFGVVALTNHIGNLEISDELLRVWTRVDCSQHNSKAFRGQFMMKDAQDLSSSVTVRSSSEDKTEHQDPASVIAHLGGAATGQPYRKLG